MRPLLTFLLSPVAALAQLQLFVVDSPGSERAVAASYDLGDAPAGDALETRLRIRNSAGANASLQRLSIAGQGFSMLGDPSLPFLMTPGVNVDFRVRFRAGNAGSYSAVVQYNERLAVLRATVSPAVTLLVERDGLLAALSAGAIIDFGRVERGSRAVRHAELRNTNGAALTVSSLTAGEPFQVAAGLDLPLTLAAGQAVSLEISYSPRRAGIDRAAMRLDGRSFALEGFAVEPPFPEPRIVFSSEAVSSAQQVRVSVRFDEISRASGSGTLALDFLPLADSLGDDPAIQFLASGGRQVRAVASEGDDSVRLDGQPETVFQTGTTAGTLVFTLRLGDHTQRAMLRVGAATAAIDAGRAARHPSSLEVRLTGFDNTRSLSRLSFTFYDRSGRPIGAGPTLAEVAEDFRRYYQATRSGGLFSLLATFPVAGSAGEVGAVEVEMVNSAGASPTRRILF